jgi:hypothetical protein
MEIGWVDTPEDWRDLFIMAYMVAGIVLFLVATLFTVIIGLLTISAVKKTRRILTGNLQPTMENVRETSETVRGTAAFVSDYAVRPVVRAYSAYAGARRFLTTFVRLARRKRGG